MFMRRNFIKVLLGGMVSFFGINPLKPRHNNVMAFSNQPEKFEMFSRKGYAFCDIHSICAVQDIVKTSHINRLLECASNFPYCEPHTYIYPRLYPYGDIRFRLAGAYPREYILDDREGLIVPPLGLQGKRLELIALCVYRQVK